jgi:hypothetical protein
MTASTTDNKRRLSVPKGMPAKSPVIIQESNEDSWGGTLPRIKSLPFERKWDAVEKKIARHMSRKLPRFEE